MLASQQPPSSPCALPSRPDLWGLSAATHRELCQQLTRLLLEKRLVENGHEQTAIERWLKLAVWVIGRFADDPFTTQQEVLAATGLNLFALSQLNAVLRASDLAQRLMVHQGAGAKYWQNTILPLLHSGAVAAARAQGVRHPYRVGIYAGASCMFHCTFCGRHPTARYSAAALATGNAHFQALFRDAPKNDSHTFYISGGLEPLTNPGIGALVRDGARHGFRLSLYTNGFMLTPALLAKQPGLWELDTLRISLYGVDRDSTAEVTKRKDAHEQVLANALAFLRLRNERRSALKLGFNFVVLPGRSEQLLRLVEMIAAINRAGGNGRQVDFLTLREDYSVRPEAGIPPAERAELVETFAALAERRKQDDLAQLHIDFGYALHALQEGCLGQPLAMVDHTAMRPHGYPQISVVVDLHGDVYLYREAGFLDRPGAERYIIGRVSETQSLTEVIGAFVKGRHRIEPLPHDTRFFDIFDHVVTRLLNQADADEALGIPFEQGPVRDRSDSARPERGTDVLQLAHPTLPTLNGASAHP